MSAFETLYAKLPVPLQHVAVSAFGYQWKWKRLGGIFEQERDGFLSREFYSREQWNEYQTRELRRTLRLALARIPFYQKSYRGILRLDQVERFELRDLPSLPILEKDFIREDPQAFMIDGRIPDDATLCPTSGSTGTPVQVYFTRDDFRRSLALREARSFRTSGVSIEMPRATFSGRSVEPNPTSTGPYHRFNYAEKQVYFSAFHLGPKTAAQYIAALHRHRTVWGTGYSGAWEQLAFFAKEQGIKPPPTFRAVITTSEKVTPTCRATIESGLGCRVYEEYSSVEDALFAMEFQDGRMRVCPDASIVELVKADSSIAREDLGEEGSVITTSFIRRSQPFIRYRVGDVAVWDAEPDLSGRAMPIFKEVVGRIEDVVVGVDGRRMNRFHKVFTSLPSVRAGQVIQESLRQIRVRVLTTPAFDETVANEIRARVQKQLTDAVEVLVEPVDELERTSNGKIRAVISRLPKDKAAAVVGDARREA